MLKRREVRDVLVLGVYFGRDLAYLAALARRFARVDVSLTGVDKFEDTPCDDWPQDIRHLGWRDAGFGEPPDLDAAAGNLQALGFADGVQLWRGTAQEFLSTSKSSFDLIYIDIAHDYATTLETIALAIPRLRSCGIVAGDDYSDQGTWGVARAVDEVLPERRVHEGWIWWAPKAAYTEALGGAPR